MNEVKRISERQARRDLDALEKLGLLRREGAGPSTVFVLPLTGMMRT
jgi:DeoR/GlpR family transcriptional regulator of sugar metabolism